MSFVLLESEVRRVWAALRFVDATSARTIEAPLQVDVPGARLRRNRSGLFIVAGLDQPAASRLAFDAYENAFDPIPALGALALSGSVTDSAGRYLARRFALALPRATAFDAGAPAGAIVPLFEAAAITLDPAPATPLLPTWAALRVSVRRAAQPAAQAAIRVRRPAGAVLGRGMTDARGEALVAVVGVAQVTPGEHELVVEREIDTEVVVSFDPGAPPGVPLDPDALAERAGVVRLVTPRKLASGRIEIMTIDLP